MYFCPVGTQTQQEEEPSSPHPEVKREWICKLCGYYSFPSCQQWKVKTKQSLLSAEVCTGCQVVFKLTASFFILL